MNDESFDRIYQAGRADLNDGIDRLFKRTGQAVGNVFRVLHRIEFQAPWQERKRRAGRA